MITQRLDQGKNKIRIESAETIEDAQKNNFKPGEFTRYFINDKPIKGYFDLINFIVVESKKNKQSFVPNENDIANLRGKLLETQKIAMIKDLKNLKLEYLKIPNIPKEVMQHIENNIQSIENEIQKAKDQLNNLGLQELQNG